MRAHFRAQILGSGQLRLGTAGLLLAALAVLSSCSADEEPTPAADEQSEATSDSTDDAQADARTGDSAGDSATEESGAAGDPADGSDAEAPADSPYAGLNPADVADILDRDQVDYADEAAKVSATQQAALGWHACRGVYEVYDEWVRTGKLGPKPTLPKVKVAKSALQGNKKWVDALYAPLADDDRKLARQQLESEYNCGQVPVAERGDRSLTIGDALSKG